MTAAPKRVCVINTHPIQYYAPLYAYLAKDPDIDLLVLYLSDLSLRDAVDPGFGTKIKWDIDLLSGYKYRFVGSNYKTASQRGFLSLIVPELFGEIRRGRFDAVLIHGYAHAANLIAMLAAHTSGAQVFFRADTNVVLAKQRGSSLLKRLFVKSIFAACDRNLAVGTRNREFYSWMGVSEECIVDVPFTIDNDRFFSESRLDDDERRHARRSLGVDDDRPVLLFASKFMPGKRPDLVIRAAGRVAAQGHPLHLVMAGSGNIDAELRQLAGEFPNLPVSFPGFVNQSEMPRLLGACDVFLFPSAIDQWGLIVNEAMAAGLPVIVGADSGCAPDLVDDGENGYLVQSNDLSALGRAVEQLVTDAALRRRMSAASLRKIETWSFRETHSGWRTALGLSGPRQIGERLCVR